MSCGTDRELSIWSLSYPLILYNTLTTPADRQATNEHVFVLAMEIIALARQYRGLHSFEHVQGILCNPYVVISHSLLSRLEDPRAQPLIEQCFIDMVEMVGNVTVLKAALHIYSIAARKANIQWSAVSGLEARLAEMTPDPNMCADWPVLGSNPHLVEGIDSAGVQGLSELLERWKGLADDDDHPGSESGGGSGTLGIVATQHHQQ